jgi:hypothetical protein
MYTCRSYHRGGLGLFDSAPRYSKDQRNAPPILAPAGRRCIAGHGDRGDLAIAGPRRPGVHYADLCPRPGRYATATPVDRLVQPDLRGQATTARPVRRFACDHVPGSRPSSRPTTRATELYAGSAWTLAYRRSTPRRFACLWSWFARCELSTSVAHQQREPVQIPSQRSPVRPAQIAEAGVGGELHHQCIYGNVLGTPEAARLCGQVVRAQCRAHVGDLL